MFHVFCCCWESFKKYKLGQVGYYVDQVSILLLIYAYLLY